MNSSAKSVAILIDGGYFLKRLPDLRPDLNDGPDKVASAIKKVVNGHLYYLNKTYNLKNHWALLYRTFYYDASPFAGATEKPISRQRLDYGKTSEAIFRETLFEHIKKNRKFALRLGKVFREDGWRLSEEASKKLRQGALDTANLQDSDFRFGLRQKGVDMRIGIDIASITLKRQASTIVLVAGDSDFVPAAKLARREGVEIILDPMNRQVSPDLFEHIDGLHNGMPRKQLPVNEITEGQEDD